MKLVREEQWIDSQARQNLSNARKGENNSAYGRVYTLEMRVRWRAAVKAAMANPEIRQWYVNGLAKRGTNHAKLEVKSGKEY